MAYILDLLVRVGVFVGFGLIIGLIGMVAGVFGGWGMAEFTGGVGWLLWFVTEWLYGAWFEGGAKGATPGKRALGLKVVRTSGVAAGYGPAILRNLLRSVDGMPIILFYLPTGLIGVATMLCTRRFQRLGDLVADTVVVYADNRSDIYLSPTPVLNASIPATPPPVSLTREEQQAIILFSERLLSWSDARKIEMANHLSPITGLQGVAGVNRLLEIARWIRES
jgi:uncharacterized RDD family membrane protein YckC